MKRIDEKDYNYDLKVPELQEKYPYKDNRFQLIGMGEQNQARNVVLYELGIPTIDYDEFWRRHVVKPDRVWDMEDEDAHPFGLVKVDCGESGVSEEFMLGEPSTPHWKLYKKILADFNRKRSTNTDSCRSELTIDDVKKFSIFLDGRLWTDSKLIVFRSSYTDYENRLRQIYEGLLPYGLDILDYNMIIPKLIPEIEDVDLGLRGLYACEVRKIINKA